MTAQPAERLWTLDQALLWYATRDVGLVQAASRRLAPEKRLTWMDWVLSSAEPMREEDAEFRRGRRLAGITDPEPEPEGDSAVLWRVMAQELHDLLAENPMTLQSGGEPVGAEWFEHGEFGYGRDGARLVGACQAVSYRGITAGSGLGALEPLVLSSVLMRLLEAPCDVHSSASEATNKLTVRGVGEERLRVREALHSLFPEGAPATSKLSNKALEKMVIEAMALSPDEREPSAWTIQREAGRKKG